MDREVTPIIPDYNERRSLTLRLLLLPDEDLSKHLEAVMRLRQQSDEFAHAYLNGIWMRWEKENIREIEI